MIKKGILSTQIPYILTRLGWFSFFIMSISFMKFCKLIFLEIQILNNYTKELLTCKAVFIEQLMAGNEHKAIKCKFHKRENISAHISLLFILVLVLVAGPLWRRCWIVACLVHTKQLLQLWARSLSSFYRRGNRRHHHRHHQHHHDQLTTLMATSVSLHLPELTTPKLPRPSSFRIFTSSLR